MFKNIAKVIQYIEEIKNKSKSLEWKQKSNFSFIDSRLSTTRPSEDELRSRADAYK